MYYLKMVYYYDYDSGIVPFTGPGSFGNVFFMGLSTQTDELMSGF